MSDDTTPLILIDMILRLFTAFILVHLFTTVFSQSAEPNQSRSDRVEAATLANQAMSDEELLGYLADMTQYMPEVYAELISQDPEILKQSLQKVRTYHSESGISIQGLIDQFAQQPGYQKIMAQTWTEDTLGYEYAVSVLAGGLTHEHQEIILNACKDLINNHQSHKPTHLDERFPEDLSFLEIKLLSVTRGSCSLYLYNGFGSYKRAGLMVTKINEGQWSLSQFNYMQSMEHHPIKVID